MYCCRQQPLINCRTVLGCAVDCSRTVTKHSFTPHDDRRCVCALTGCHPLTDQLPHLSPANSWQSTNHQCLPCLKPCCRPPEAQLPACCLQLRKQRVLVRLPHRPQPPRLCQRILVEARAQRLTRASGSSSSCSCAGASSCRCAGHRRAQLPQPPGAGKCACTHCTAMRS